MIPHPNDINAPNCITERAKPEDAFSTDREVIFDQASRVELLNLGPAPDGRTRWFLVFGRWCHILAPEGFIASERGIRWGVEIAAYACTEDGAVRDWNRRYEMTGTTFELAAIKLRFQLANDLADLSNSEEAGNNLNSSENSILSHLADA